MTTHNKEIEILKIAINDEHHYRTMVQSRISYHSSIILALIALSGALALRSESLLNFIVIATLGLLISYISCQAVTSIERLYDHFIEAIRAREEIEIQLGIRDITKPRKSSTVPPRLIKPRDNSTGYWQYEELLSGSWIPPGEKGGYFERTRKTFNIFYFIGFGICGFMLILGFVMAVQGKIV